MDAILLEDSTHGLIAENVPFVRGVLELVFMDVFPEFFNRLRPRELIGRPLVPFP